MKIYISKKVQRHFGKQVQLRAGFKQNPLQIGEDVFITNKSVGKHKDSTEDGKNTILCMLHAKGSIEFVQHQSKKNKVYVKLEVGTIIRFDARLPHELHTIPGIFTEFAAIIWDVPKDKETKELVLELEERIKELKIELPVIDSSKRFK